MGRQRAPHPRLAKPATEPPGLSETDMTIQHPPFNRRQLLALGAASVAAGQWPQAWAAPGVSNAPMRYIVRYF